MGGRSKFSFPIPGRRHVKEINPKRPPDPPISSPSTGLSKAQRLLGTESDLNIDSPSWDGLSMGSGSQSSWRTPRPMSSAMSISISESTQSTYDGESGHEQWEMESGVFPRPPRGFSKASSTLLGQHYHDDGATDESSLARQLRHEDSSSTLKSYYDRQKSPLAISQQTSESSARDLALRKGFPPVSSFHRSPLLQVDNVDPFQQHFAGRDPSEELSQEGMSRKKPAKLDLSMLFARSKKYGKDGATSPSSIMTNDSSYPSRRKLTKSHSKESLHLQTQRPRSNQPSHSKPPQVEETVGSKRPYHPRSKQRDTQGTLYKLYDNYELLPARSHHMSQIPETSVPDPIEIPPRRHRQQHDPIPTPPKSRESRSNQESQPASGKESFSWKNVRAGMASPHGEASSAASISSRNSKTSRHTSVSTLSNSDLRKNSVLSLSSDSEDEPEDESLYSHLAVPTKNSQTGVVPPKASEGQRFPQIPKSSESMDPSHLSRPPSRTSRAGHTSRKASQASCQFVAIPELKPTNPHMSGPWSPPNDVDPRNSVSRDKNSSKRNSFASATSQQPTPPLSPSSMEFRPSSTRSSRFMAVTKQEEALLEALRQKRAKMREKIIKEHERVRTPLEAQNDRSRYRFSETSSASTLRGDTGAGKEEILLYLDTPVANMKAIDHSEPSPDLSDFLTFGSDEDSAPRTKKERNSKSQPRPDSFISPSLDPNYSSFSPLTPPTAARLSAVGGFTPGFREARTKKRSSSTGVRFVDDGMLSPDRAQQDYILDDDESGTVWGLSGHI